MKKYILMFSVLGLLIMPSVSSATVDEDLIDVDPNPIDSICVSLVYNLRYQSRDITTNGEVSTLQDFLQSKGYLNSEPTGYFGLLTLKAAKDFQSANGIQPTGYVGPITRAKIAALTCGDRIDDSIIISGVSGPQTLKVNQKGTWTVSAYSRGGGNLSYNVVWGDEEQGARGVVLPMQQSATFTHRYTQAGLYQPQFVVRDEKGSESASTSLIVNVGNVPVPTSSITVLSPNGGESLPVGSTNYIKWDTNNTPTNAVAVITLVDEATYVDNTTYTNSYFLVSGYCGSFGGTCVNLSAGSYKWTVPSDIVPGNYRVLVACAIKNSERGCEGNSKDFSDRPFAIISGTTETITPFVKLRANGVADNGADRTVQVKYGESVTLSWNSNGEYCEGYTYNSPSSSWNGRKISAGDEVVRDLSVGKNVVIVYCYSSKYGKSYDAAQYAKDDHLTIEVLPSSETSQRPYISSVQAPAESPFILHTGERATIYGTGLYGRMTVKVGSKSVSVNNYSSTNLDFMVPSDLATSGDSELYVVNSSGVKSNVVSVDVTIGTTSNLSVSPSSLTFRVKKGQATTSQSLLVTPSFTGYSLNTEQNNRETWLDAGSSSSTYEGNIIYVTVEASTLSVGTYTANIFINDIKIPVTLIVSEIYTSSKPNLSYLSPASGQSGTVVQIRGTGFSANNNINGSSQYGDFQINNVFSGDGETLVFTIPSSYINTPSDGLPFTPGVYKITVTNTNGTSNSLDLSISPIQVGRTISDGSVLGSVSYIFTQFLSEGAYGGEVSELQKALNQAGYDAGFVDGHFGLQVKTALMKFQTANGLKPDGIMGYETRTLLNK